MKESDALVAAVAVEHEVVYGYGVAGAHLTGRDRSAALAALDVHRVRRDRLMALTRRAGRTPPAAQPAYALPFAVTGSATARRLCALLEDGCTGAAWDLTAASAPGGPARLTGVGWLTEAATRAAHWHGGGAAGPALPGRP